MLWGLLVHLAASVTITCWDKVCASSVVGDKFCDKECMSDVCKFDSKTPTTKTTSDCYSSCLSTGCKANLLGNKSCNAGKIKAACNSEACGFDYGDCGYCANGCTSSMLGNGRCDSSCNVKACRYDANDCVSSS
jgi:hypothetical protein